MKRSGFLLVALALLLVSLASGRHTSGMTGKAVAAQAGSSADSTRLRLSGHVPRIIRDGQATKVGSTDPAETIVVALTMHLHDEAGLNALVKDISDPGSPNYGQYLTPVEFSARFGATDAERSTVERFLAIQGLRELETFNNGTLIAAEGTASVISTAFDVELARYRDTRGFEFRAPGSEPSLPADVAGLVAYVSGLDSLPVVKTPRVAIAPLTTYTPAQLRTAYDSAGLISTGINGSGETLASVQFGTYSNADITTFNQTFSVGSVAKLENHKTCNGALSNPNYDPETTLDIELQMAAAPGVGTILDYNAPIGSQACYDTMIQQIAADNRAKSISTSWGLCEPSSPNPTSDPAIHNAFLQMASQGQSFFAASGDDGAHDCYTHTGGTQTGNYVDYPASDDHVTGVGGTTLTTTGGNYLSETTWNQGSCTPSSGCGSGGGGLSQNWSRPSWQVGPGTTNSFSNGKREVPDVSLDADPNTGYDFIYQGTAFSVGGTSAAAPTWAGYAALYNQYARTQNRPRLGFANPALYGLANSSALGTSFHDVTVGTNITYPATAAFDLATGWGSPDVKNLIVALAAAAPTNTATSTPTLTSTRTATRTPTISYTATTSPTPTTSPTAGGSLPPTATFTASPSATQISTSPDTPTATPTASATSPATSSCTPVATAAPVPHTPGAFEVFLPSVEDGFAACGGG